MSRPKNECKKREVCSRNSKDVYLLQSGNYFSIACEHGPRCLLVYTIILTVMGVIPFLYAQLLNVQNLMLLQNEQVDR